MSSIDVTRDLLNLDFIVKSDEEKKDFDFTIELKSWKARQIEL